MRLPVTTIVQRESAQCEVLWAEEHRNGTEKTESEGERGSAFLWCFCTTCSSVPSLILPSKVEAVASKGKQSLLSKQASTGSLSRDCKGRIEEKSKEEEVRGRKGEKVLFSCCKAFLSYSLNPSPLHITWRTFAAFLLALNVLLLYVQKRRCALPNPQPQCICYVRFGLARTKQQRTCYSQSPQHSA